MQRAQRLAIAPALVERLGLPQGFLAVEMDEGVDLAVDRLDAIEAGLDVFGRAQFAASDALGSFDRRERRQIVIVHHQFAYSLPGSHSAMPGKT